MHHEGQLLGDELRQLLCRYVILLLVLHHNHVHHAESARTLSYLIVLIPSNAALWRLGINH